MSHQDLGEIHLGYIKGLGIPYAMTRAEVDRRIQREYPGPVLAREEYQAAAEATLESCECGGRFRYDAPARCPTCRSRPEQWDQDASRGMVFYD